MTFHHLRRNTVIAAAALVSPLLVAGPASAIIGGGDAPAAPSYMASLQKADAGGDYQQSCGGTLIDSQWILTAGHCKMDQDTNGKPAMARIGSLDRTTGGEWIAIDKVVTHPDYKGVGNDLALLKLKTPATGAPMTKLGSDESAPLRLLGFGQTNAPGQGDPVYAQYLKQLDTNRRPMTDCPGIRFEPGNMMCVDNPDRSIAFKGDSGGPLLVRDGDGLTSLAGLVKGSVGNSRDPRDDPWAATDLNKNGFRDWIHQTIADSGHEQDYQVAFDVTAQSESNYTAALKLSNTSKAALKDWTVSFKLPAGTTVTAAWGDGQLADPAHVIRSGETVTIKAAAWNPDLAPGQSATVTLTGAATPGSTITPSDVKVNGQPVH